MPVFKIEDIELKAVVLCVLFSVGYIDFDWYKAAALLGDTFNEYCVVPVPKSVGKILTTVGNRSVVDTKYDLVDAVNEVLFGSLVNLRVVVLDVEIIVVSSDVCELVRMLDGLLDDGLLDDGLLDDGMLDDGLLDDGLLDDGLLDDGMLDDGLLDDGLLDDGLLDDGMLDDGLLDDGMLDDGLLDDGLLDDGLLDDGLFIGTVDLRKPGELKPGKGGDNVPGAMFRRL